MENDRFKNIVLELSGPARDRTKLARLLGISESTAYGWISLAEKDQLTLQTSVRGQVNRAAKQVLVDALEAIQSGDLQWNELEGFVRARKPEIVANPTRVEGRSADGMHVDDEYHRHALRRGLLYAVQTLDQGAPLPEVIAALEVVTAMFKENPMTQ